jgi:hypothetical protein
MPQIGNPDMGTLKNIARQGKDKAVSLALEKLVQRRAERFWKILNLRLDSKNKELHLEILLKGESKPIEIHVKHYEIISTGDRHFVIADDIDISREWMKTLALEYIGAKPFEIPVNYLKIL